VLSCHLLESQQANQARLDITRLSSSQSKIS